MMVSTGTWDDGQKQQLQEQQQFFQEAQQNNPFRRPSLLEQSGLQASLGRSFSTLNPKLPSISSSIRNPQQGSATSLGTDMTRSSLTYESNTTARRHTSSDAPVFTPVASTVSPSERMFTVSRAAADGISAFPGPYRFDSQEILNLLLTVIFLHHTATLTSIMICILLAPIVLIWATI